MNLPSGTAPYMVLYLGTLVLHVVFLSYVLVAAAYFAVRGALGKDDDRIAATFRDWLPFSIGAAITAGVAPLLFVQLLYQERFYTANLLMNHRWMMVVPALIVGFYASYVAKSKRATAWSPRRRAAAAGVAAMCFVFVAYSWTEHHLLSLRKPAEWAAMYGEGRRFHTEAALVPRLLLWLAMSAPVAATVAAWQVRDDVAALARLRVLALVGLVAAAGAGGLLYATLPSTSQALVAGGPMSLVGAGVPALGFAIAWLLVPRARTALIAATALMVITLIAGALLRERLRLPMLAPMRPRVTEVGGRVAFVAFGGLNFALMVWAIRSALKHLARRD